MCAHPHQVYHSMFENEDYEIRHGFRYLHSGTGDCTLSTHSDLRLMGRETVCLHTGLVLHVPAMKLFVLCLVM